MQCFNGRRDAFGVRRAFTLIEILIGIALATALMALALMFMPKTESRLATQGADQLQTFLASARARALRDGVPTGVRLIQLPLPAPQDGNFRAVEFIQTPEPLAFANNPSPPTGTPANQTGIGMAVLSSNSTTASFYQLVAIQSGTSAGTISPDGTAATPFTPANLGSYSTFNIGSYGVAVGDLIEVATTGEVHRVTSISGSSVTFASPFTQAAVSSFAATPAVSYNGTAYVINGTAGFRFIREPRPLMGETPLQLPRYVRVNSGLSQLNTFSFSGNSTQDIIFAPSGQIVNVTRGRVVLWIDDDNGIAQPSLLCIYARTGGVASHPVNTDSTLGDAYFFTTDGKNSGQ